MFRGSTCLAERHHRNIYGDVASEMNLEGSVRFRPAEMKEPLKKGLLTLLDAKQQERVMFLFLGAQKF